MKPDLPGQFTNGPERPPVPPYPTRVRLGSPAHKAMFCAALLDTFNPYKPSVIEWPKLDPEALGRVTGLPIWDIAVETENKASLRMLAYARLVEDPLVRQALELNGWEESRHRHVLSALVGAYGIRLKPEKVIPPPTDTEWAYMVTGFSECVDSFFAFGLFEAARRSGFFPPELVATFEPVVHEEARHILFFVNWVAWHRRQMPWWRRPWFELKVMAVWLFLAYERMGLAKDVGTAEETNFTVAGGEAVADVDVPGLLDLCLAENDRRLAPYDKRLVRPVFFPRLVRLARKFMGRSREQKAALAAA
jgi:hypothetical protein